VRLAKFGLLYAVDLCDSNVLGLESGGSFLVVRGKRFTMTAPTFTNEPLYT
jgi:hypothetical protein